jgi:hypothetical protein
MDPSHQCVNNRLVISITKQLSYITVKLIVPCAAQLVLNNTHKYEQNVRDR